MNDWKNRLKYDPTTPLAESDDIALSYAFQKDILGKTTIALADVWQSNTAQSILTKQRSDGSWRYTAKRAWPKLDYDQYETVKQLAALIEKHGFRNTHDSIYVIAEYYFGYQSSAGDIRGIYGNQYSPNYTAMILELLMKAGYASDERILRSLDWLLNSRQEDGGWALALRTRGLNLEAFDLDETIEGDLSKPYSAMVTGVVLRALAAHPRYQARWETAHAGKLLADSFFTSDKYPDRKGANYWTRFSFPFVYTDLVSALDSLSRIGGFEAHPKVQEALRWLEDRQSSDGLFGLRTIRGKKQESALWLNLAICRIYKRFYSN
ncbi:MAG: prenyltransferase/squalene oxidase repeat-containing protein [Cyanobacteria bacterium J06648_16]